jgi:hypothetical protein
MQNIYHVKTLKDNRESDSTIEYIDSSRTIKLIYKDDNNTIENEDDYPFFALIKIRLQLEGQNALILCNGARVDVYPSGSSPIGPMSCTLKNNRQATELVNIFESMEDVKKAATVTEQKLYRDNWLKSL